MKRASLLKACMAILEKGHGRPEPESRAQQMPGRSRGGCSSLFDMTAVRVVWPATATTIGGCRQRSPPANRQAWAIRRVLTQPTWQGEEMRRQSSGTREPAVAVTRRQFLTRVAAVGGGSLAYEAMAALGLLAAPSQASFNLAGRVSGVRVVILGAGLSG